MTDRDVIAPLDAPRSPEGGLAVLRGSLAPSGAVIKLSAASPELFSHRGPAVVFEDVYDLAARIDEVDATPDSVLVMRNSGPKGGPGMPEWGQLPVPRRLLERGVKDVVRISDARMSGTAFGTVVLHVAPESAAGGPLAVVRDGDPIVLDVEQRRLDLDLPADEIARRLAELDAAPAALHARLRRPVPRARPPGRRGLRLRLPPRPPGRAGRERAARPAQRLDRRLVAALDARPVLQLDRELSSRSSLP